MRGASGLRYWGTGKPLRDGLLANRNPLSGISGRRRPIRRLGPPGSLPQAGSADHAWITAAQRGPSALATAAGRRAGDDVRRHQVHADRSQARAAGQRLRRCAGSALAMTRECVSAEPFPATAEPAAGRAGSSRPMRRPSGRGRVPGRPDRLADPVQQRREARPLVFVHAADEFLRSGGPGQAGGRPVMSWRRVCSYSPSKSRPVMVRVSWSEPLVMVRPRISTSSPGAAGAS